MVNGKFLLLQITFFYKICLDAKISKDEFDLTFDVSKIYKSVSIEKKFLFFIKEFLTSYPISNQRISSMKRNFIQFL